MKSDKKKNSDKKENKEDYNPEVTMDDVIHLGERVSEQRNDKQGDDAQLESRERDVDFTGKDLDVPGRDLPKDRNKTNLKDEENQLYSQGSGHNDHLEDAENKQK
ncbi:hypothetical protein [Winogradskyella sp.]|uniref:hypothetical protein n=1 Tax=unclassified Winogradskyella TaxID=2615021 RepID=UPI001B2948EC|nr:hypothetical protein [Winogradskyella sp.]MBO6881362.1 hypothetical protein [Winogradskyella sp.]